jgi:hypothetical protein
MNIIGKYNNVIAIPSIDKTVDQNTVGLIATPEGRLITAIFIQALEDLDFELKEGYPLDTLDWFMSESPMLHIACWLLEWNVNSLRQKIKDRIKKDGRILNLKNKDEETEDEDNA